MKETLFVLFCGALIIFSTFFHKKPQEDSQGYIKVVVTNDSKYDVVVESLIVSIEPKKGDSDED